MITLTTKPFWCIIKYFHFYRICFTKIPMLFFVWVYFSLDSLSLYNYVQIVSQYHVFALFKLMKNTMQKAFLRYSSVSIVLFCKTEMEKFNASSGSVETSFRSYSFCSRNKRAPHIRNCLLVLRHLESHLFCHTVYDLNSVFVENRVSTSCIVVVVVEALLWFYLITNDYYFY